MQPLIGVAAAAAIGALGAVVATTFELLPERVDLVSFVLQSAGFASLLAVAAGRLLRLGKRRRENLVELGTVIGAAVGLIVFLALLLVQEVR